VESLLGSGWSDFSSKLEPGKDGGALGVLYIGRGSEGSGRESGDRWWVSIAVGFEAHNKGRGDRTTPICEGKGGGTGGALARLHLSAGERPSMTHDAVASREAAAAWLS
jgi:hypothetical protein